MRLASLIFACASVLAAQGVHPSESKLSSDHLAGLEQYGRKDYKGAVESFRKAMDTEASDTAAYRQSSLLLGESLYLLGRYAESVVALKQSPRTSEALYMLGSSYMKLRETEKCVSAFAEMFGIAPDTAAAHLVTAQLMSRQELLAEAEAELNIAISIDGNLPQAHYLLGELLTFKGETDRAIEELKKEIRINPASALGYYKLGDAYSRKADWTNAIPLLHKSVWLNPTYSGPYILLGKGYLQQKELSNAEGVLRRAIQLDPNNSSAHYLLGQTLVQEGRTEEGRAMLQLSQKLKN